MNQLTIRGVPDEELAVLREEASARGCSLNTVVREALSEHVERERRRRVLQRSLPGLRELRDRLREAHGGDFHDSAALIRADRER